MTTRTDPRPLDEIIDEIRANPEAGVLRLAAEGTLGAGLTCDADARVHHLVFDEPAPLGGTDLGPNPVETVLSALGACQAITYRVWAAILGVELTAVRFEVDGDIDLAGFLGLRAGVRPGLGAVRHRVTLRGPEPEERYRELAAAVNRHCPVLDLLAHPVPVELRIDVEPDD